MLLDMDMDMDISLATLAHPQRPQYTPQSLLSQTMSLSALASQHLLVPLLLFASMDLLFFPRSALRTKTLMQLPVVTTA
jgi:hypothetical protein